MATASLASSLGWKFMKPSGIQRREKFTTLPMKGTSTSTSSTSANTKTKGETFSQKDIGTCSVTSAATKPMASAKRCRCKKKACE